MSEPARILTDAAGHVRAFNHATITTGPDWQYPSHSYDALGSLAYLLRMLPQAAEQAITPVMHMHGQGRVLIDGGGSPNPAIGALLDARTNAVLAAEMLVAAVDRMHSATAAMGLDTRGLPEFEGGDE